MKHALPTPYRSWFLLFTCYNLIFLSLEIGFIYTRSSSFIHAIALPPRIYWEFVGTLFIQLTLTLLLSLLQTTLLWGIAQYQRQQTLLERWHISLGILSIIALFSVNAYYFP